MGTDEAQFASIEQFPLNLFAGLQSDGRSQRNRKIDIEFRGLALGTDGLHF